MTPLPQTLQVKPSGAVYGRYVKQGLPVFGLLAAFFLFRTMRDFDTKAGRVTMGVLILVLVALVAAGMLSYVKGASVTVAPHEVDAVGFLWRHRRFAPSEVAVAVTVAGLSQPSTMRPPVPLLVLLDHQGRRLLRLNGALWDTDDLGSVSRAIGAPIDAVGVVGAKDLAARHPQAVLPMEIHPWRYGLLIALAIIVVVVVVVVAVMS